MHLLVWNISLKETFCYKDLWTFWYLKSSLRKRLISPRICPPLDFFHQILIHHVCNYICDKGYPQSSKFNYSPLYFRTSPTSRTSTTLRQLSIHHSLKARFMRLAQKQLRTCISTLIIFWYTRIDITSKTKQSPHN